MQTLHAKSFTGDRIDNGDWFRVLNDAFLHIFANRVTVNLNNIDLNNMDVPQDTEKFFRSPRLAEANAIAYSRAFADGDAGEYTRANAAPPSLQKGFDCYAEAAVLAYSTLTINAMLAAYKGSSPPYDRYEAIKRENACVGFTRLAYGLLNCLRRAVR